MDDLSREPVSLLISYWYFRSDGAVARVVESAERATQAGANVRILLDSGAFSAHSQGFDIRVADYASWLEEVSPALRDWLVGAITLDVLNDEAQSWDNWAALQRRGLDTVPAVHLHARLDAVDRYVDAGVDWLALGAMVGQSLPKKFGWAAWVHRHLRDQHPHVRTHGLGATSEKMIASIPWWSVDSSSFGSGFRYGRAKLYDPATRRLIPVSVNGSAETHRHGRLLRDVYGIDPATVRKSSPENREVLLRAATRAILLWQRDLRRARPIEAPGSRSGGSGTHLHPVLAAQPHSNQAVSAYLAQAAAAAGPHVHAVNASVRWDSRTIDLAADLVTEPASLPDQEIPNP